MRTQFSLASLDFQARGTSGIDGAARDLDEYKRDRVRTFVQTRTFRHIPRVMNCTFLLTLTGLRQRSVAQSAARPLVVAPMIVVARVFYMFS